MSDLDLYNRTIWTYRRDHFYDHLNRIKIAGLTLLEMKGRPMNLTLSPNDITEVVEADRAHIWHHLMQHKSLETVDPRIIVEGKGMKVWDAVGREHLDAVSGGVWTVNGGYGRVEIADAVRDQLVKMN